MVARYYSSSLGRFMVADPASWSINPYLVQTWNLYAPVLNNPLIYVDRYGLSAQEIVNNPRVRAIASFGASALADIAAKKLPPGKARGAALVVSAGFALDSASAAITASIAGAVVAFGAVQFGPVPTIGGVLVEVGGAALAAYDFMLIDELLYRASVNLVEGWDPADEPGYYDTPLWERWYQRNFVDPGQLGRSGQRTAPRTPMPRFVEKEKEPEPHVYCYPDPCTD
jgi:hypothetical protein